MPLLYITPDYEYAIDFPKPLTGFRPLEPSLPVNRSVQTRKRVLDPNKFIIGRDGRLVYDKRGYQRGDEAELGREILKSLSSGK